MFGLVYDLDLPAFVLDWIPYILLAGCGYVIFRTLWLYSKATCVGWKTDEEMEEEKEK